MRRAKAKKTIVSISMRGVALSLAIVFVFSIVAIQLNPKRTNAAGTALEQLSHRSPDSSSSSRVTSGVVTDGETHAFYMRSNPSFGDQEIVRLGVYFDTPQASTSFDFVTGGDAITNSQVCNKTIANGHNRYIKVDIGGRVYYVGSTNVCSTDTTKANRFYKTYAGPATVYDDPANPAGTRTGKYKLNITIQYNFGEPAPNAGEDADGATNDYVQFRVLENTSRAKIGPIGGNESPGTFFPIIGRHTYWSSVNTTRMRIPFGPPCNAGFPASGTLNTTIDIFDIDWQGPLWPNQDPYITVYKYDQNSNYVGLVTFKSSPITNGALASGNTQFYLRGGNTSHSKVDMDVQQGYKYQLNIFGVDPRNTIDIAMPFSTIWGGITCSAKVSPQAALTGTMEDGTLAGATAGIFNAGNATGSVGWDRYFWYEDGGTVDTYDSGVDTPITTQPNGSSAFNPGPGATTPLAGWGPVILDGNSHRRVCTSLFLKNPSPAYTSIQGTNPAKDCRDIVRKPYFHVFGGDVSTMGLIANSSGVCAGSTTNNILATFNQGLSGTYKGAGTQVAAFAGGLITEFTSASQRPLNKPAYLSFSNTSSPPYGGNLTWGVDCVTDFGGAYGSTSPGDFSITAPVNVSTAQPEKFVKGNVFINNNVTYATSGLSFNSLPYFRIIADGNIYVSSSVTRLDGIYEATGKIYTCAVTTVYPALTYPNASNGDLANTCKGNQLKIRGALIANQIKFLRTYGTVGLSDAVATNAAETITFGPESWLQSLRNSTGPGGSLDTDYNSIVNLPPVL